MRSYGPARGAAGKRSRIAERRVQLFATCLGDLFFPEVVADAKLLLEEAGYEVGFPPEQVCCGQPAFNAGHRRAARRVARTFTRAFSRGLAHRLPVRLVLDDGGSLPPGAPWSRAVRGLGALGLLGPGGGDPIRSERRLHARLPRFLPHAPRARDRGRASRVTGTVRGSARSVASAGLVLWLRRDILNPPAGDLRRNGRRQAERCEQC
jgi:hypothetical protein